jgi:hypothetical protein
MKLCHYAECHCAECHDLFIGMRNVWAECRGAKNTPRTNALAYFALQSVTEEESFITVLQGYEAVSQVIQSNGRACFKKWKQLFKHQHLLLLRDILLWSSGKGSSL